jgi:hypothetical protein
LIKLKKNNLKRNKKQKKTNNKKKSWLKDKINGRNPDFFVDLVLISRS